MGYISFELTWPCSRMPGAKVHLSIIAKHS
jgi:hypothetical protein